MGKFQITSVNPKEILLENIFAVMANEYFGKDLSAKIVGGVKKLEDLIAAGKIEAHKPQCAKRQMVLQCGASVAALPEHEEIIFTASVEVAGVGLVGSRLLCAAVAYSRGR